MKKTKPSLTGALALLLTLFALTPFAGGAAPGATSVVVWGEGVPSDSVPEGLTNVIQVTTGVRHCAALRVDGTVISWGIFDFTAPDEVVIPQPIGLSNVVAIASGKNHVLALKSDGTVVRWGRYRAELTAMPVGLSNVVAIAGGFDHSLALKADGTVVAWQTLENVVVPANLSNVLHIAATTIGGMALRQDGSIVGFENSPSQVTTNHFSGAPLKKIATQLGRTGFLRVNGTITLPEFAEQIHLPATNLFGVTDLDIGANTMLALRSDGTIVGFGESSGGQELHFPAAISNNVLGISIYERSVIALLGDPVVAQPPQITQGPTNQTVMAGGTAVLTVSATGTPPLSYQWRKAGVPLAGQTASVLAISNVTVTAAGNYDVVVAGAGSVTSAPPATLTVLGPPIITSPAEVKGTAGVPLNYQITAIGNPTGFQAPGLPAGLTFNPSTGQISGAPAAGGQTDVTLVATNLYGAGFQTLTVKVRPVGTVVAWGSNTYGEGTVPADLTNVVTVSAGQFKSLALLNTGNVVEWGDTPALPPALGNVTAISAGFTHFLALLSNGTVVGGGGNAFGESTPPVGLTNVVSVTAGDQHSAALRQDGTVVAWGRGDFGQTNVPANLTNVIAIDAGGLYRTLALKADGTVVQWGSTSGIVIPPNLSNLVAIAAGDYHSLALRQDGTVVGWGFNDAGQTNIPVGLTNVVAIAAGSGHSLALKANGTVVAWGTNSYGQFPIPAALTNGSNVVLAIAARNGHSLAVVPNAAPEPPTITLPPQSQTVPAGGTPYLFVSAAGTPTLRYQWFKAGVPVGGATNALFGLPNIQPPQAGGYYVVVTNAYGAVTSSVATLTVNAPGTLLSQNFEGGTDLNLYQSLSAPGIGQFNSLSAGPSGALVSVTNLGIGLGNSLVLSRPGAGSVSVVRTTDLAASVGAVVVQMRFTPGQIQTNSNSVLSFQLGTNFSGLSQAETGPQVAAQIAVDLRGLEIAGDQWGWSGSPTTFNGFAAGAFPLVTWAVNNSGGPVSYTSPNGGSITLADGKFDLWVGDSGLAVRVFNGAANLNAGVPLRNFKLACDAGNASYGLDEFTITKIAAEAQPTLLFNSMPRSVSTTNGGTVTLNASVTGTGSLTYRWIRNGSMVPGATDSQLVLNNLDQFSEGFYQLAVTGPAGSITSSPPAVVVALPASSNSFAGSDDFVGITRDVGNWGDIDFTSSAFNAVLHQNSGRLGFSMPTAAEGGAYRVWKKGIAPASQDWEARVQVEVPNLAFATNGYVGAGLFVLNAADPGDRLNLEIEVGKDNGFSYRDFYVTHTRDDVEQLEGSPAVPATAVGYLRARWVASSGVLFMEYDPDGPANGENWVTLRSFSPSTNWGVNASGAFLVGIGAYAKNRTVDSFADGVWLDNFATSGGATGTPPVITVQPQSATVLLNQHNNMTVTATGSAPLAYQWFRFFGSAPFLLPGATNSYYPLQFTSRYPSGSYFVVITNAFGSITSSPALLRVLVPQRLLPPERLGDGRIRLLFGDQDGGFMSTEHLAGFEVYATTNVFLTNSWVRLTNGVSVNNGQVQLEDSDAPGLPRRFYRVIER